MVAFLKNLEYPWKTRSKTRRRRNPHLFHPQQEPALIPQQKKRKVNRIFYTNKNLKHEAFILFKCFFYFVIDACMMVIQNKDAIRVWKKNK